MCVQVIFLGEAEGGEARVNMEEHSVAVWVDETDVEGLEILSRFLRFEMNPERDEVLWRPGFVSAESPNLFELERVDIFESRMFFLISHPIFGRIGRVERRGEL